MGMGGVGATNHSSRQASCCPRWAREVRMSTTPPSQAQLVQSIPAQAEEGFCVGSTFPLAPVSSGVGNLEGEQLISFWRERNW